MATANLKTFERPRRDSIESRALLWEKTHEANQKAQQDAPFATDTNENAFDQYPSINDFEPYDPDEDSSLPISIITQPNFRSDQSLVWENETLQDHLIIIINESSDLDKVCCIIKNDLSKQGLKWTDEEEERRPWRFGLTAIRLQFSQPRIVDIPIYCLSTGVPIWLKLKSTKQKQNKSDNISKKSLTYKLFSHLNISLRYGAFIDLNKFHYSPEHSWTNSDSKLFFILDDQRYGKGCIEWIVENSQKACKKQLLVTNINECVVVDWNDEGFSIYIWQKCNMNEFETDSGNSNNNNHHRRYSSRDRKQSDDSRQPQRAPRSSSKPCRPPPIQQQHQQQKNKQYSQRTLPNSYHRVGFHPPGCYFSNVEFSMHIDGFRLRQNDVQNTRQHIRQTLITLIDFFRTRNIPVCYGKISSNVGPQPYLFFEKDPPNFPTLLTTYSWQMLSINGYRLQLRINKQFLQKLHALYQSKTKFEELFYRVCVYLSRISSFKPFLDINQELSHAITESERKLEHVSYDLERHLDSKSETEVYVPSITITPTTIRVKPLKLCRTNRVLRATNVFGKATEHFVLVDIRDEHGQELQSYHFQHLHNQLLSYLSTGFHLMGNDRWYKYLHHSQSQVREKQFWFYHTPISLDWSFEEAYKWMGEFSTELNPAKYAARMALCFSTTKPTVEVPSSKVRRIKDITTADGKLSFTDGCGTMSTELRDSIKTSLRLRADFSAVQFRYGGAKGVISVYDDMPQGVDLCIRDSMQKFTSTHEQFEICKLSAPRPLFLNRQAIMLLSYRKVSDTSLLILQQQNHLALILALLRNDYAEKLILQKLPSWLLPENISCAKIDYIHEPFFRQVLISACLQSVRQLLQRTRIRIPPNKGRNMIGIVDEYNVLKPDEVYIQYTVLDDDPVDDFNDEDNQKETKKKKKGETEILHKCTVVITKNPCHHPGDIRTFTAVKHSKLKHLKDVVVFSQQGKRPAPHDISGSDLDGDEYLVIWHDHLVPHNTPNAEPYDYDAAIPKKNFREKVTREVINETILNIAEQNCLGRLSNLHLAFADKFGIDDDQCHGNDIISTIELAAKISQEVDSPKTGYHPLNEEEIGRLNNFLGKQRPDYIDKPNYELYPSNHILGHLYRASKKTLRGWNQLIRYHRHLRHLQVRTNDESEEEVEELLEDNQEQVIKWDQSIFDGIELNEQMDNECSTFAKSLVFVYRQEILEILSLYGLSHESDLWCRNSSAGISGELEDTAYSELEQLVTRTRNARHLQLAGYCITGRCNEDTRIPNLCKSCKGRQTSIAMACYKICYGDSSASEQAPILSLPWIFSTSLLQKKIEQEIPLSFGLLSSAIDTNIQNLVKKGRGLRFNGEFLKFKIEKTNVVEAANVNMSVFALIEVLEASIKSKEYPRWPFVLSRFVRKTSSFKLQDRQQETTDEWILISQPPSQDNYDEYCALLLSIVQTEMDSLIHGYFQEILKICFAEGRRTNDQEFLNVSEKIISLLQRMAIKETIISA